MSAPQYEGRSIDLSGSRWREARARTAIPTPVASHGLKPRSGQLAGTGNDPLNLTILHPQPPARADSPAPAAIGERGPLLAVLDWAQRRGVDTSPAREALSPNDAARPIPLRTFQQIIADVQHECTVSAETAWGLFPSDQTGRPLRMLVPTDPATTLLATPTAAVGISNNGLHLLRRHIILTGWRRTEGGLLLTTPDGQRRLGPASLSARLLEQLGRNAPQIELRRVPLSALLGPMLNSLAGRATSHPVPSNNMTSEDIVIGVSPA